MRVFALGIVTCVWLATAANAQSVNDTITRWGLLGTWTADCKVPVGDGFAVRQKFTIRAGKPVLLREGAKWKDESPILAATVAPDQSIEIRARFVGLKDTREWAYVRGPDQRIQTKFNRGQDGAYTIFDKKMTATGADAPWQSRCGD